MTATSPTTFLSLPVEIRLVIYRHLLVPSSARASKKQQRSHPVLHIRLIDPLEALPEWSREVLPTLRRTTCLTRTGRFRGRIMQTTYTIANNPGIHAAILAVSKQIHAEGVGVLFRSYIFDFGIHVEAIPLFLADLTEEAKSYLRRVGLVKRALPYDRDFDCAEWRTATYSIAVNLPRLRYLHVGVMAGKPGPDGWDDVRDWSKHDLESWTKCSWTGLEWVRDLARIRADEVVVKAVITQCPTPGSERMGFWIEISKSVAVGGFGEWISGMMELNDGMKKDKYVVRLDGIL